MKRIRLHPVTQLFDFSVCPTDQNLRQFPAQKHCHTLGRRISTTSFEADHIALFGIVQSDIPREHVIHGTKRSTQMKQLSGITIFFCKHFNLRLLHPHHPPIVVDLVDSAI